MPDRISLDKKNVTLKALFELADKEFASLKAEDLTIDQVAILNLKRVIELKDQSGNLGGGKECFICGTGA